MPTVKFTRQVYPRGGGFIIPAGSTRTMTADEIKRLPKGSYVRMGAKTKPMQAAKTKG